MIKAYPAQTLTELTQKAAQVERRRSHLNVHDELDAPVQRLFIATEPDTYMRPHWHPQVNKWEFFIVLEGQIDLLLFETDGVLRKRVPMSPTQTRAVEIPPGTCHAYVCQQSGTLALEVKEGPYTPTLNADFATWSPAEGAENAAAFRDWMQTAKAGKRFEG